MWRKVLATRQASILAVLVLGVAVVAMTIFMRYFRWGRYVYAIGGNEEATRFSGIPVARMKLLVYTQAGLFSALAGGEAASAAHCWAGLSCTCWAVP